MNALDDDLSDEVGDEQQEKPDISSEPDESKYGQNPFNIIGSLVSV
jgi:hypothetical protein